MKQDQNTLQKWVAVAEQAARQAGELIQQKLQEPLQLKSKGFRDLVTDSDLAAQQLIVNRVRENFPGHGFVAEEEDSTLQLGVDGINWIIDPIDGTSNYSRQIPNYSVSIGITVDDEQGSREVAVGVIYDPSSEELFSAIRGQGSWVNGRPIQVSTVDAFAQTRWAMDWCREESAREKDLQLLNKLAHRVQTVRSFGSAALGLAWVAAGRIDVYTNHTLSAWDLAAGSLLITEAGGMISDMAGEPVSLTGQCNVLATNSYLYSHMLDEL